MKTCYYFSVCWCLLSKYSMVWSYNINQLITNLTIQMAKTERTRCIKILTPNNLTHSEQKEYHRLMKSMSMSSMCGIYKMENYYDLVESEMEKSACFKPIRVVLGSERSKKPYAELSRLYPAANAIWIVFLNTSISEFFEEIYLTFSMEVIVARIRNESSIELYEVYRVGDDFPMRIKHYGNWTAEKGLEVIKGTLYERRFDLEGKVFRTGSTENWPFTSFKSQLDPERSWDGLYARIWSEMEKMLNFTSIHYLARENSAGIRINGTWNGLMGMLLKNEIDVIVSELRVTSERLEVLDFTYPIVSSWYQVFFKQPGYNLQWDAIFKPFDIGVWLAMVGWILAGTLSLSVAYYFSLLYGFETHNTFIGGPTETFFFMIQTLCQQGSDVIPSSITCRFLFFLCYLVSSVLIPSYSASLISSLTYHSPVRPFDSFEEMLTDGRYKLFVEKNTAEYSYFEDTNDHTLRLVREKLLDVVPADDLANDVSKVVDLVCDEKHNYAYFGVQAAFESKTGTEKYRSCPILSFSKPLTKIHESMALLKGNPYIGLINYYLHKMVENGIIDNTRRLVWPIKESWKVTGWTPVETIEIFQIFVYLLSGIVVSIIFLMLEKYFSSIKSSQKIYLATSHVQ